MESEREEKKTIRENVENVKFFYFKSTKQKKASKHIKILILFKRKHKRINR